MVGVDRTPGLYSRMDLIKVQQRLIYYLCRLEPASNFSLGRALDLAATTEALLWCERSDVITGARFNRITLDAKQLQLRVDERLKIITA